MPANHRGPNLDFRLISFVVVISLLIFIAKGNYTINQQEAELPGGATNNKVLGGNAVAPETPTSDVSTESISGIIPSDLNKLFNSSFEAGALGAEPRGWSYILYSSLNNTKVSNVSTRTGNYSLKFEGSPVSALGISQPNTKTINGRNYIFSLNVRSFNLVGSPTLRFGFIGSDGTDKYTDVALGGVDNKDWKSYSFEYENAVLGNYPFVQVSNYQGGSIYLEDLTLYEKIYDPIMASGDVLGLSTQSILNAYIVYQNIDRIGDGSLTVDAGGALYPTLWTGVGGTLGRSDSRFGALYVSNIDLSGNISATSNLTIDANGYTRIGDTATPDFANGEDDLFVEADFEANGTIYAPTIFQGANQVCDSSGNCAGGSGGSKWKELSGAISPYSDTLDVLIGNSASTSAKFAFKNVSSGVPTASISGTTTNVSTFIDGNGNISTTNRANLVLGNSSTYDSTGGILLNPNGTGNVGVGTTDTTSAKVIVKGSSSVASVSSTESLTADGGFDSSSGWTVGSGWTIGSSVASHASGSTGNLSGTSTATSTTTLYRVRFVVTVTTAGTGFNVSLGSMDSGSTFTTAGTKTVYIRPTSTSGTLRFSLGSGGTFVGTIDTVTINALTESVPELALVNSNGVTTNVDFRAGGNGNRNIFIGTNSGKYNTSGTDLTGVGYNALSTNYSGFGNSAFGGYALYLNNSGYENSAFGNYALRSNISGVGNSGFGMAALYNNTTGNSNTSVGYYSLNGNSTSDDNTALGSFVMSSVNPGASNTGVGAYALDANYTGTETTAIGAGSGGSLTSGSYNTLLGTYAGDALTTGSNNIVIGYNIDLPANNSSNMLDIGNLLYATGVDGSGTTLSTGKVGVGTVSPLSKLSVVATSANSTGKAAFLVDQYESQDIFTASSSGTPRFTITSVGNLLPGTDNTQSIGASSSARWKDIFLGPASTHIQALTTDSGYSGLGVNLDYALGINTAGAFTVSLNGIALTSITQGGSLGIGTSDPEEELDIEGQIQFDLDGTTDQTIGVCKDVADAGGVEDDVEFADCSGTPGDIAEYYRAEAGLLPGDVVSYKNVNGIPTLTKTGGQYDSRVYGVVSTFPVGQFGKPLAHETINEGEHPTAIALTGKVPVLVSTENGNIEVGDSLTPSSTPGVAMKATKSGKIIGYALENYDGSVKVSSEVRQQEELRSKSLMKFNEDPADPITPGVGKIMVSANLGWFFGELSESGNIEVPTPEVMVTNDTQESTSSFESDIEAFKESIANLEAEIELLKTTQLTMEVLSASDSAEFTDSLLSLNVLGNTILGDTLINGELTVGKLTFDNTQGSIDAIGPLKLQPLALDSIEFVGGLIKIDNKGNLSIEKGIITGNESFRDSVLLPPGETKINVERVWEKAPSSIQLTPSFKTQVWVTDLTEKGFTINVGDSSTEEQKIYWFALW